MATYQLGSVGAEVSLIESALKRQNLYRGPIDGIFGGATESALIAFQRAEGLTTDGIVGQETWEALVGGAIAAPRIAIEPLAYRCLALTGSFETSAPIPDCFAGLTGNSDGQGISFGVLQWNLGQGTLPPLLKKMKAGHPSAWMQVFGSNAPILDAVLAQEVSEQLSWARSIQDSRFRITQPWKGQFLALGRTPEFQEIEVDSSQALFSEAIALCPPYSLTSTRAVALMFDILTQDGSIGETTRAQILRDYSQLPAGQTSAEREVSRMEIVAKRRAAAANSKSYRDVLERKMAIAVGEGTVHGSKYILADYGLTLDPF